VGKSAYLLETLPAMRGIGYGLVMAMIYVTSYYSSLLGLALKYLYESFVNLVTDAELPWTICNKDWGDKCFSNSFDSIRNHSKMTDLKSSAELYFE
jgi:solute carrier family 6 (neurotransmitter transporter, glycine) member 5/9